MYHLPVVSWVAYLGMLWTLVETCIVANTHSRGNYFHFIWQSQNKELSIELYQVVKH
jgi:hypothetical protein